MALLSGVFRRNKMRGDAPVTCMLIIVGILAICIGCYYMFWYNRALERAEKGEDVVVVKKTDPSAFNAYRLRVRDKLCPNVRMMVDNARKACGPVIREKVTDVEETKSELNKCIENQREYIGEINGQNCPAKYEEMHKKMAMAIGKAWKGCTKCEKALKTDDARERKIILKSAHDDLNKAKRYAEDANRLCKAMFVAK